MSTAPSLGMRLANANAAFLAAHGSPTAVNGVTVLAVWKQADKRVARFLGAQEWAAAAYDVVLPPPVLAAPCSIAEGVEIDWAAMGWRGVVRAVSPRTVQGVIVSVWALVQLTATD